MNSFNNSLPDMHGRYAADIRDHPGKLHSTKFHNIDTIASSIAQVFRTSSNQHSYGNMDGMTNKIGIHVYVGLYWNSSFENEHQHKNVMILCETHWEHVSFLRFFMLGSKCTYPVKRGSSVCLSPALARW